MFRFTIRDVLGRMVQCPAGKLAGFFMRNKLLAFAVLLLLVTPQIRWEKMPTARKGPAFLPNIERTMLREGRLPFLYQLDQPKSSQGFVPNPNPIAPRGDCQ